jgi:hypothetical protein
VTARRRGRERASVLMLMPAGVLVVLLLGAIAFDLSLVFLRQRQASSLAVDLANDLATAALDEMAFRSDGVFRLDPERAEDLGTGLAAASDLADEIREVEIEVVEPDTVTVRVVLEVEYVFARALPGAADGTTVAASATVQAASADP